LNLAKDKEFDTVFVDSSFWVTVWWMWVLDLGWGFFGSLLLFFGWVFFLTEWYGKNLTFLPIYGLGNQIPSLFPSIFSSAWLSEPIKHSPNNANL